MVSPCELEHRVCPGGENALNTSRIARPRVKLIARLLIVPALLLAGYAGTQLAPLVHATASSAASHPQFADTCTSSYGHC